ncbi:type I-C CRISPR-associated protein Cas7/Csd2 [Fundicoccus culcitae]|uniref:Type I-C CRISPR-associated protein Cas7/Csd2 n=1 Tax=Fundicoccus culcitae TaxID=2969821 RepID=A0ABY5P243_9LACT|nr:type I-C CRISPR-associated protein Cas7/Csd2 [Fundicoccus culcitae]UUX32771.1 type I-C CRISPR-associated protein Cas7/Csd2 [Fundicoccus culcitae]
MALQNKIDFIATIEVINANPNGDPLNNNSPRINFDGYGIISDVALKRKIRNRLQNMGKNIFVQSKDRIEDGHVSLKARYLDKFGKDVVEDSNVYAESCKEWIDVRSFGQVMTFGKIKGDKGTSIGIRGPVSIGISQSLSPVTNIDMQITRSIMGDTASDTMGLKHYVEHGVYLLKGSINPFFAEKTGFTEEDANLIKEALRTLFINDSSAARPEGSMSVRDLYWIKHPGELGVKSSGQIFNSIEYNKELDSFGQFEYEEYNFKLNSDFVKELEDANVTVELIEGQ